jgi:hypothetical protein
MTTANHFRISRRAAIQAGVLLLIVRGSTVKAQAKIAQNLVHYQQKPKGTEECEGCLHFMPPDACKMVAGKVSPKGWCALFAPKPK